MVQRSDGVPKVLEPLAEEIGLLTDRLELDVERGGLSVSTSELGAAEALEFLVDDVWSDAAGDFWEIDEDEDDPIEATSLAAAEFVEGMGLERDDRVLVVHLVELSPGKRGRGLGTRVVRQIEDAARSRGLRAVMLHSAFGSETFWRKMGYDTVPGSESPFSADLVMWRMF